MSEQATINVPPAAEALKRAIAGKSYWARVRERLMRDRLTVTVMLLLLAIVVMSLAAPVFATHDPTVGSVLKRLKSPGFQGHWLGTDEVGRDLWSRILYGGRYTLLCGVAPVFLALIIGGSLGLAAGFLGGITNSVIMRSMDVLFAFPSILLAVAICGLLGSGVGNTILALTISFIPPIVRISETVTTQVRGLEFVEAARASGARPTSIIRFHILNNVLGPILVYATSLISISIILAAGLSFLGLGVTPPDTEWGLMLNNLRQAIWVNPLVAALPGAMIFITSMCFNLMSDGLRSAMDVRM
jgi:peptide/nickel transport system permease protein